MSVLIKGMEMPTRCFACPMCEISDIEICCSIPIGGVAISYEEIDEQIAIQGRPSNCPLIEVVMCKDCIHRKQDECARTWFQVDDNDFCSHGERKQDEHTD